MKIFAYVLMLFLIWVVGIAAAAAAIYAGFSGHEKLGSDIGVGLMIYCMFVLCPSSIALFAAIHDA